MAHEYLNKVLKSPVGLPSRIGKILRSGTLLEFETEEMRETAAPIVERLSHLVQPALNTKN